MDKSFRIPLFCKLSPPNPSKLAFKALRSILFMKLTKMKLTKMKPTADAVMEIIIKSKSAVAVTKYLTSDIDLIKSYNWHFSLAYAKTSINGGSVGMHRIIMGVTDPRMVVDHINQDKLDNRRTNLRIVTRGANNQNRTKTLTAESTSKYKGVTKRTFKKSCLFVASCGRFYTQSFKNEDDAARAYDKAALHYCGIGALTNFEYTDEETKVILAEVTPTTPVFVKKNTHLPKGVFNSGNSKTPYEAKYSIKSLGMFKTADDASKAYEAYVVKHENEINDKHISREIIRNKNGNAVLPVTNRQKEVTCHVIVDDSDWHELMKGSMCVNPANYVSFRSKGTINMLHRYLLKPADDLIVDHINGNKLDNRRSNLRIVNSKQSSYNKAKLKTANPSSPYKGVSKVVRKNKAGENVSYIACVMKDAKRYGLGSFKNEEDAARAYNEKAQELFGEYAYLNVIPYVPPTKKQSDDVDSSDSEDDSDSDSDSDSEPEDDSWYLDFMSQF